MQVSATEAKDRFGQMLDDRSDLLVDAQTP
jgi:hypothetical protein